MPLAILRKGELDCPTIVCDQCGEEITDVRKGNYQWAMSAEGGDVPRTLHFTHKRCARAFEAARPLPEGMSWGWGTLGDLIPHLMANLGLTDNDVKNQRETIKLFP